MNKYQLLTRAVNEIGGVSDLGTLLVLTEYPGRIDIGVAKGKALLQATPLASPEAILHVAGFDHQLRDTIADALMGNLLAAGFDFSAPVSHTALKAAAAQLSTSSTTGRPQAVHLLGQIAAGLGGTSDHLTLKAVEPPAPRKTQSYNWRFSAENIFGWEMGHVELWFDAVFRAPCTVVSWNSGVTSSSTAITVRLSPPPYQAARTVIREREGCPNGLMEGVRFEVNLTFDGYVNNVAYSKYMTLWADGTVEYGPPPKTL